MKANRQTDSYPSTVVRRKGPISVLSACPRRSCRRKQFCFSSADERLKYQLKGKELGSMVTSF